jgi:hypothetical protein
MCCIGGILPQSFPSCFPLQWCSFRLLCRSQFVEFSLCRRPGLKDRCCMGECHVDVTRRVVLLVTSNRVTLSVPLILDTLELVLR